MRSFMKSRDSLKDSRIAYTYLIILALVLAVMGLVITQLKTQLGVNELIGYRETLAECSDSLRAFAASNQFDRKLTAALRFEIAAASLACGDRARSELLRFAGVLRKSAFGEESAPDESVLYELSDMFILLAMLDYKNGEAAREHITNVLSFDLVSAATGVESVEEEKSNLYIAGMDPKPQSYGKMEQFVYTKAADSAEKLLGKTWRLLNIERSDTGYTVRADNVRAEFSNIDGSAEKLLHIRLGRIPDSFYAEYELSEYAKSIAVGTLGADEKNMTLSRLETFCGFTTVEFNTASEKIILVLDSHSRLWAIEKSKKVMN